MGVYLSIMFSLSPYSFDVSPSCIDVPVITHDSIPIGAIPILASSTNDYSDAVTRTINAANVVYHGISICSEVELFMLIFVLLLLYRIFKV